MALDEQDIAQIGLLFSAERLAALNQLTGSIRSAIELHQETLSLGASLMNVTATIEIALRNTVCENLSSHFGVPNWLFQPPVPFQWRQSEQSKVTSALDSARRAKYTKLSQVEKGNLDRLAYPNDRPPNTSHLKRAKDRRKQIAVSDGSVIAELTFYFWKRLYGPDYEQSLWRTTLKRTFPNKRTPRAVVANNLEEIYQSRNRLAHHEPVLHKRFRDVMNSIIFVVENLGENNPNPNSALAKILAGDIAEVTRKADALHARLAAFRLSTNP